MDAASATGQAVVGWALRRLGSRAWQRRVQARAVVEQARGMLPMRMA